MTMHPIHFVFTWAASIGPCRIAFSNQRDLLNYLAGWCQTGDSVMVVSSSEVRG